MKLKTEISRRFSIEQCRLNFKSLFIFGDSLERYGEAGQAIIRREVNSIGIATKKKPSMQENAFFTDVEYEQNCKLIDEDIQRVKDYAQEKGYISVIFPQMGIGTGLADMQRKCPKTFLYLSLQLLENFSFNNIEFLYSKQF